MKTEDARFKLRDVVTRYTCVDRNNLRVHVWGQGDFAKFAVGHGPIQEIDRPEAERLAGRSLP